MNAMRMVFYSRPVIQLLPLIFSILVGSSIVATLVGAEPESVARWDGDSVDSRWQATPVGQAGIADGLNGRCFDFNGEDACLETDLAVSPSDMPETTWMAWAYPRRNDGRRLLLEADDAGFDRFITIENGQWGVGTGNGIWCPAEALVNKWQHVAVVYTPDTIRFFLDGEEYFCPEKPVGQESLTRLRIGGSPLWRQFFDGLVDDIRVYDRALAEEEIREVYEKLGPAADSPGAGLTPESSGPPVGKESSEAVGEDGIDGLVKRAMKTAGLKSLGVAVIQRGQPVVVSVQGKRGGEKLGKDDPFVIASCSKAFTATLAGLLVSKGQIRWDTTIGECFGTSLKKMHPEFRGVTLAQLLHHEGGAPERDRFWGSEELAEAIRSPGSPTRQRRALIELVTAQKPDYQPGTKASYSNAGYYMAAAMIEKASGRTWESLVSEQILRPLRMGSSSPASRIDPPLTMPAGGVAASMADLGAFFAMHMDHEKGVALGLSREAFDALHTPSGISEFAKGFIVVGRPWSKGPVLTHLGINRECTTVFWLAPTEGFGVVASTWTSGPGADTALDKAAWQLISAAHARTGGL